MAFSGRVAAVDQDVVEIEVEVRDGPDGSVLMPARAKVRLPGVG
jgi:hypothetical protein